MTTFANGESGLSVRTKINNVLQHADGTAGELVINEAGADVDFRVESDTNANALFVDGATGNVGIGTSSIASKLHVVGTGQTLIRIRGGGASNQGSAYYVETADGVGTLAAFGDTAAILGGTPDASAAFYTNGTPLVFAVGTERMRIDSSGNVGIGTSSPSGFGNTGKLVVSTVSSTDGIVATFANSGGTGAGIQFFQSGFDLAGIGMPAGSGGLTFVPSGTTERMRLDIYGNLLIGTTSSGASKLRISGLPTSSAGLSAGDVWNDAGTLKIA